MALSALLALSLLAAPAGAMAQDDPTEAQYDPSIELISQGGGSASPDQVGGLPFTGFDVAGLLIVGACMAAVGVFLYRRSRHPAGGEAKP